MPSQGTPTSQRLDPVLYNQLRDLVCRKNKERRRSATIKGELEAAVRKHLTAEESEAQAELLAPAIYRVLDERVGRLEHRLAALLAKAGLDAATGLYLLLYVLHETNRLMRAVQPDGQAPAMEVEAWYDRARARAIRHLRDRDPHRLQSLEDEPESSR